MYGHLHFTLLALRKDWDSPVVGLVPQIYRKIKSKKSCYFMISIISFRSNSFDVSIQLRMFGSNSFDVSIDSIQLRISGKKSLWVK